ncbi:MAG: hypothetical protein COA84_14930 [Robiginitomaculum sp.]|nr:MAG: hypothetical protein COA84_14930 [Robiginitomaculum sp.]
MEFKLGYEVYPFGMSLAVCKRFTDATGLDLHPVLMDYINTFTELKDASILDRLTQLSKLYPREVGCHLFASITDTESRVPLEEFQDATFRVSWVQSSRDDDLSEPWPLVIVGLAMQVNKYINDNLHVKKKDTSD